MRKTFYDFKANVDLELPSRVRLHHRLGEYDTLAEYTYLTLKDFEANWNGVGSHEDYVSSKAIVHDVKIRGGVTLPNYESALIKSFLVNSHAMLEDFVDQYKMDIRNLIDRKFSLDLSDKLSKAEKLLSSLEKISILPSFPEWLLPVMKYYRLVRNSVAHNEKDMKSCETAYKAIDIRKLNEEYPTFSGKVPNVPNNLNMDDFYFYSACIKHFANYLTMALKGKVNWSNLGNIHESFDVRTFVKGTCPISLINREISQYKHVILREEQLQILADIKKQKELLKS